MRFSKDRENCRGQRIQKKRVRVRLRVRVRVRASARVRVRARLRLKQNKCCFTQTQTKTKITGCKAATLPCFATNALSERKSKLKKPKRQTGRQNRETLK
jgi:hypothetical protein